MNLKNLHSITLNLVAEVGKILREMSYVPVESATKTKVVEIGFLGWEQNLDIVHIENEL